MFNEKMDIRLPGPTVVPPQVQRAIQATMNHPMMDYRDKEFSRLLATTSRLAARVFRTENRVLILAGSGTAALEAAMVNLVGPGDTVILCINGYFGEYIACIAARLHLTVVRVDAPWGETIGIEKVEAALRAHPEAKVVFATHCETSTGVTNDIEQIGRLVREHDGAFIVDAVSSLGSTPLEMDAWGVDVLVSSSQKALMLPPGAALISLSAKAWGGIRKDGPSHYFDVRSYDDLLTVGQTPFTPNVSLTAGLQASLELILEEGLNEVWDRHTLLRDMTRAGVHALGLNCLVSNEADASRTLTTVMFDSGMAEQVRKHMRTKCSTAVGGGLGKLKGRVVRLGHLGYTDGVDVLRMIASLELAVHLCDGKIELGAGVAAAQHYWLTHPQLGRENHPPPIDDSYIQS